MQKSPITQASQGLKPVRGVSFILSVPVPVVAGSPSPPIVGAEGNEAGSSTLLKTPHVVSSIRRLRHQLRPVILLGRVRGHRLAVWHRPGVSVTVPSVGQSIELLEAWGDWLAGQKLGRTALIA